MNYFSDISATPLVTANIEKKIIVAQRKGHLITIKPVLQLHSTVIVISCRGTFVK